MKFRFSGIPVALAVARATLLHNATSIVGGGDSAAALEKFNLAENVSHVSTGGGACLPGMAGLIAGETRIEVKIAPNPLHAVIDGARKMHTP